MYLRGISSWISARSPTRYKRRYDIGQLPKLQKQIENLKRNIGCEEMRPINQENSKRVF